MYGIATRALVQAAEELDTSAPLSLELDRVPAMLQYALDSHTVQRSHVQYQSMERWLLGAFGMIAQEPQGHFDNLMEYCVAQRALFGAASNHLAHGPGSTNMP